MEPLLVALIVLLAITVQSLVGFGAALLGMPLLVGLLGIQVAAPLVALLAVTAELVLVLYYRRALSLQVVWQLVVAAALGIPLGVLALELVDEDIVLAVLGLVILLYALYALLQLRLPELRHPLWAWGAGFLAGILGGAYNTSGPPIIVYGNCRRWPPAQFIANLQGFFLPVSLFVAVGHGLGQNLTPLVWRYYLISLAPMGVGIVAGLLLARRVNPVLFRKLVLGLLLVLGASLLLS